MESVYLYSSSILQFLLVGHSQSVTKCTVLSLIYSPSNSKEGEKEKREDCTFHGIWGDDPERHGIMIFAIHSPFLLTSFFTMEEKRGRE